MDNVEIMVNELFSVEPETILMIYEHDDLIAVVYKEDWNDEKYSHIKEKCRKYKPPLFYKSGYVPLIGVVTTVNMEDEILDE